MTQTLLSSKETFLSVVIATLGGDSLLTTISSINSGSVIPDEILVCIPENESYRTKKILFSNVTILITPIRGQVGQRSFGFSRTKGKLILQLDDDVILDKDCISKLIESMNKFGPMCAVGPALIDNNSGFSIYNSKSVIFSFIRSLISKNNSDLQGKITKLGLPLGVNSDTSNLKDRYYPVDWIPGGCVLHNRATIIRDNYFPFDGKAYCEDLIHSKLLADKGVKLIIDVKAKCRLILPQQSDPGFCSYICEMARDLRARKYYMQISGRSSLLAYGFFVINIALYSIKKIKIPRIYIPQ